MKVIVAIDDTDNLECKATGQLAKQIARVVEEKGWGKTTGVSRHQLLIHPDIPYTSHNSSMCFTTELQEEYLDKLIEYASDFLKCESAEGSDPGLCVVPFNKLSDPESLIAFGRKAKEIVIRKEEAYQVARQLGIHLSEHGGTGQGVIGALAGAGLRLSGNDGRYQGSLKVKTEKGLISAGEICSQTYIDCVRTLDGMLLEDKCLIKVGDMVKPVILEGKSVLLVSPCDAAGCGAFWQTCTKQQLEKF